MGVNYRKQVTLEELELDIDMIRDALAAHCKGREDHQGKRADVERERPTCKAAKLTEKGIAEL